MTLEVMVGLVVVSGGDTVVLGFFGRFTSDDTTTHYLKLEKD